MRSADTINLKALLDEKGITLYRLCQDTGLSYQQGFAIANNKTKKIEFQTIQLICDYLSCGVSDLINIQPKIQRKILKSIILDFPQTNNARRESSRMNRESAPFLQWVGGKRALIPQYQSLFPKKFNRYIEPFLGGGAIYFHLKARRAIINDSNPELVSTYEGIRDNPTEVIELLKLLKERHSHDLYLMIRNLDRQEKVFLKFEKFEIAARMIYLNQTCFNGVYRVNKQGQFNVPIGSSLNRLICDEQTLLKASEVLQTAHIKCTDFDDVIRDARKGDFVYLDPPYFPISKYSDFTRYTKEKFHIEDQERLGAAYDSLHRKGCKVMLSNSNCDFIKNLYKNYQIREVLSGRTLNVDKTKRGKISELVVTNY